MYCPATAARALVQASPRLSVAEATRPVQPLYYFTCEVSAKIRSVANPADITARRRAYFQLQTVANRLRTLADEQCLAIAGVTAAQVGAMYVIAGSPGCTQRTVATALRQRESAITAMIRRLTNAGLVERRASATDGRAWELQLTRRGLQSVDAMRGALDELNAAIGRAVGADKIETFMDGLDALSALDFRFANDAGCGDA
jgi:DNA-binding MarR family transcriptional regulator